MPRINPYKAFDAIIVPLWLILRGAISQTGKLLYGLLLRHAKTDGSCSPKRTVLAEMLGISVSTVNHELLNLQEQGLIEIVHVGNMRSAVIYFLRPPDTDIETNEYKKRELQKLAKQDKEEHSASKPFIDKFCQLYREKYGCAYYRTARDMAVLKRLVEVNRDILNDAIEVYLDMDESDPNVAKFGHTIVGLSFKMAFIIRALRGGDHDRDSGIHETQDSSSLPDGD